MTTRQRIGLAVAGVVAMAFFLVTSDRKPVPPIDPRGVRLYGVPPVDERPSSTPMTSMPAATPGTASPSSPPATAPAGASPTTPGATTAGAGATTAATAPTTAPPAVAPPQPTPSPAAPSAPGSGGPYRVVAVAEAGTVRVRCRLKAAVVLPEVPVDKPQGCGHDRRSMPSERLVFHPETLGVGNCFVTLPNVKAGKDWNETMRVAEPAFLLDQKGCVYVPHVGVIRAGTSVSIRNSDRAEHNIHAYRNSMAETTFNISSMPDSVVETADSLLERSGHYIVKCDIHPWMSGHVLTTPNPYFAVTSAVDDPATGAAAGEAVIEGVPPGVHQGVVWHEGVVETVSRDGAKVTSITYSPPFTETFEVTVEPGKAAVVDVTFQPR